MMPYTYPTDAADNLAARRKAWEAKHTHHWVCDMLLNTPEPSDTDWQEALGDDYGKVWVDDYQGPRYHPEGYEYDVQFWN